MLILIANLGSTSYKFSLYRFGGDGSSEVLSRGGFERVEDYAAVIDDSLQCMEREGHFSDRSEIAAVGFKTVMGRDLSGCVDDPEAVIAALDGFAEAAPAHNPPYIAGIRQFGVALPEAHRVALFETAFYQWVPEAANRYAVPADWHEAGIRRYGFHGASHKFIAERSAELLGRDDVAEGVRRLYLDGAPEFDTPLRVVSCHLGGSSSVTGIRNGVAIGSSMGFSPQSGLPQNNRVGDLDAAAIPYWMKCSGQSLEQVEQALTKASGLLGLSGISNDLRDIREAAGAGNPDARLALEVLVHSCRHWISSFLFPLGGLDALVFTAGIGENNPDLRAAICTDLGPFGIELDAQRNAACQGTEAEISAAGSSVKIFVIPANEELVLAREVHRKIQSQSTN